MAAKKLTPAQQRDRRAKIMLGFFGVVLLVVLGVQLPKLLGGSNNGASTAPPVTTPAAATASPQSASLASAPTQLQRFTRFAAKDPFKAGYTPPTGTPSTTPTSTTPKQQKPLTINVTQSPPPAAPTVPAALLMVNGKKRVVALGATFPQKSPMFRIVALSQKSIWIELIAGSFSNGKQTLKIDRGSKVTLDNVTADLKFVLSLVRPTTAPASPKKTA